MIRYLLDTDTASFVMNRYSASLSKRFNELDQGEWAISAVTYAELLFGLEPTPIFHPARQRVASFIKSVDVLPWPAEASAIYAEIRHRTRAHALHDGDIFIAAHAIAIGATLITNNTRYFNRMGGGLRIENWLDPSPATGS